MSIDENNKKAKEEICLNLQGLSEREIQVYESILNDMTENKYHLLDYAVNKVNDFVIVAMKNNAIYLFGCPYKTIMYAPKLMFHLIGQNHIHIDDILVRHKNVGNGSIMMKSLLKFAKTHNISLITGDLSSIDDDHKARRNHYYEKFGFQVKSTYITKNLKEVEDVSET